MVKIPGPPALDQPVGKVLFAIQLIGVLAKVFSKEPIIFLFVSFFDIGEVPRSPGKLNWNRLSFLPFVFIFEQCGLFDLQLHNCNDEKTVCKLLI